MIWLDSLLAVPLVGVHLVPNLAEIPEFQKRQFGFIDYLSKQEEFGLEKLEISSDELWAYSIKVAKTGFMFKVKPSGITGQFVYQVEKMETGGALPSYRFPDSLPYSQQLDRLLKYLGNILGSVASLRGFKFQRIGIVANVNSARESLPPGVLRWLDYSAKPWGNVVKSEGVTLAKLSEEDSYHDRCHHHLSFDETEPQAGMQIMLDWQRVFEQPMSMSVGGGLPANVEACKAQAIDYFQRFGEGDLNYD